MRAHQAVTLRGWPQSGVPDVDDEIPLIYARCQVEMARGYCGHNPALLITAMDFVVEYPEATIPIAVRATRSEPGADMPRTARRTKTRSVEHVGRNRALSHVMDPSRTASWRHGIESKCSRIR